MLARIEREFVASFNSVLGYRTPGILLADRYGRMPPAGRSASCPSSGSQGSTANEEPRAPLGEGEPVRRAHRARARGSRRQVARSVTRT